MNACHPHIVQQFDFISHHPGSQRRLGGDRYIGGPGGNDQDFASAGDLHRPLFEGEAAAVAVVGGCRECRAYLKRLSLLEPRDEDVVTLLPERVHD